MQKTKKITLILSTLLILAGCNGTKTQDLSQAETQDYNDFISRRGEAAYTDFAYLFRKGEQIRYLDATLASRLEPLCAKANCSHRDGQCDAYVGGPMFAYKNHIYYVMYDEKEGEDSLYRMDAWGTEREKLRSLADILPPSEGWVFSYDMGGGYLLVDGKYIKSQGDQEFLYLVSLEEPDREVITVYLGDEEGTSPKIGPYNRILGDWVFYQLYEEADPDVLTLMGYQISTGRTVEITEKCHRVYMQKENEVYWINFEDGVFSCDLDSMEIRQLVEWKLPLSEDGKNYFYSVMIDEDYIYMSELGYTTEIGGERHTSDELGMKIYDQKGQEVFSCNYKEMQPLIYLLSSPEHVIFGVENEYYEVTPTCYLERSAIAEGKAEFIPLQQ